MPQIVTTEEQLRELVDDYLRFPEFAVDVETRPSREPYHAKDKPGLDSRTNDVFWVSLAGPGRSDAIPIQHPLGRLLKAAIKEPLPWTDCPDPRRCERCKHGRKINKDGSMSRAQVIHTVPALFGPPPEQLTHEQVWPVLKPLLLGDARKIGHNIKFDAASMAKYLGEPMAPPYGDTMLLAKLVNENHLSYKLGEITKRLFKWEYDKSLGKLGVENFSFQDAGKYARLDSFVTWHDHRALLKQARREGQEAIYDLETKVIEMVVEMETNGAPIDVEHMVELESKYRSELEDLQTQIEEYNGGPINLNADAQVRDLVYGKRGRKVYIWTEKTEQPSTSKKALERHAFKNPQADDEFDPKNIKDKCVAAILEYAQTHKIHSTYLANNLPAVLATGRLYGEFDQMGTVTGRFSARQPNLQNIPIRSGPEIRKLFVSGEDHKLLVVDYSQVELRILAHFTQDPLLIKAYTEGFDLHSATARAAYGISESEEVPVKQRSLAKNVNFSVVYGATAYTLINRYEVPEDEAEDLINAFYKTYRKVGPWQRKTLAKCRQRGRTKKKHGYHVDPYVETILGRRRRLPEINFPDINEECPGRGGATYRSLRRGAERQAINTIIQGTAADIMKLAMVELLKEKAEHRYPLEFLMTVHDEMVVRVPESDAEDMLEVVQDCMERVNMLRVPLLADGAICETWDEGK